VSTRRRAAAALCGLGPAPTLGEVRGPRPLVAAAATLALLFASRAEAEARPYRGPHPVDLEGHWHLEDGVHVHEDLAVGTEPFGAVDGVLVFLADPVAYGWTGEVWTFRGAHPLPGGLRGYCGIGGDHRHPFAPEGAFRRDDGVYVFTGAMRGGRDMVRPGRLGPRHPVVVADRPPAGVPTTPGVAPFWYAGCLHRLVLGPRGPVRVPLPGCRPHREREGHAGARGRPGRRAAPPAPSTLDGNYTRFESRPARAPAPPRSRSQGRARRP